MREWELDPETYSGEVVTELKLLLRVRLSSYGRIHLSCLSVSVSVSIYPYISLLSLQ